MAYADLDSFSVQIQLWMSGSWTYNCYHAEAELTLAEILNREPQANIELSRSFSVKTAGGRRIKTVEYPVHKLWVSCKTFQQQIDFFLGFIDLAGDIRFRVGV